MDRRPDLGRIKDRTRKLSKSLLGTQFRAEVGAYIAEGGGPFWARAMAKQLEVPENKVSAELSRFAENDLLVAMSVALWDRRRLYETATGSAPYWANALDIVRRAAEEEDLRLEIERGASLAAYLEHVHRNESAVSDRH